ncbi:unnamed protein product, partial [Iphiclides podalirius]
MSGTSSGWCGAVMVCALVTTLLAGGGADECAASADGRKSPGCVTASTTSDDLDEESDTASFLIVVEHQDGWRCAASLVSMRTGVTSARCARGRSGSLPRELWALAAAQLARRPPHPDERHAPRHGTSPASTARRVSRIALAGDRRREGDDVYLDDLAVLELEAPFGSAARTRPILMATSRGECEKETTCHAVRAATAGGHHRARFHVVTASIVAGSHCASRVLHWLEISDRALCLAGDELCTNDRGTGVVCGGKLCGVLSESVPESASTETDGCGGTHVAQSVARWRSFLHCAHTLRACGRGDCETLCSEHRLLNGDSTTEIETVGTRPFVSTANSVPTETPTRRRKQSSAAQTSTEPILDPLAEGSVEPGLQFTVAACSGVRTQPSRLQGLITELAGEYGDNAAEYEEATPMMRAREQFATSSQAPVARSPSSSHSMDATKHSPPPAESLRAAAASATPHAALALIQLTWLTHNVHLF